MHSLPASDDVFGKSTQKSPLKPAGFFVHEAGYRLYGRQDGGEGEPPEEEPARYPKQNKKKISAVRVLASLTAIIL